MIISLGSLWCKASFRAARKISGSTFTVDDYYFLRAIWRQLPTATAQTYSIYRRAFDQLQLINAMTPKSTADLLTLLGLKIGHNGLLWPDRQPWTKDEKEKFHLFVDTLVNAVDTTKLDGRDLGRMNQR
jgi:hypothetical protein